MKPASAYTNEIKRITNEVHLLCNDAMDVDLVKKLISSDILPQKELDELIETKFNEHQAMLKDKAIEPKTIIGSLAATILAGIVGGTIWGLLIYYFNEAYYFLLAGIYLICYFIIWLVTKQSRANAVVFIASFIATIGAALVGFYVAILLSS